MATLYRQYRPQKFDEVIDQNAIKTTLKNEIKVGQISQAYLFCGPRAVGKTTLARIFAKSINCQNPQEAGEPCNECQSCVNIQTNQSLNVIEIDAASHTGVDNVRENIINSAQVPPGGDHYKVFIIDEIHMLSISAFNALLKVIEEPPKQVIFIFCTTEIHKVPTTIISRCQRFDFKRITSQEIIKKLKYICAQENIDIEEEVLESIARESNGYMRDAESLLGQIMSISDQKITSQEAGLIIPNNDLSQVIQLIEYLTDKNSIKSIQLINNLIDNGLDLRNFIKTTIEILRKMMLDKVNTGLGEQMGLDFGEKNELKLTELIKKLSIEDLTQLIENMQQALNKTKDSTIIQLPLELKIVEWCNSKPSPGPAEPQTETQPDQDQTSSHTATNEASASSPQEEEGNTETKSTEEETNSELNLEEIKNNWNKFLLEIQQNHHSISFILQNCQPTNLEENKLTLSFKHKFHKDRLQDTKITQILEETLKKIYNTSLRIESCLDENLQASSSSVSHQNDSSSSEEEESEEENQGTINNLLNTLGGKVIN